MTTPPPSPPNLPNPRCVGIVKRRIGELSTEERTGLSATLASASTPGSLRRAVRSAFKHLKCKTLNNDVFAGAFGYHPSSWSHYKNADSNYHIGKTARAKLLKWLKIEGDGSGDEDSVSGNGGEESDSDGGGESDSDESDSDPEASSSDSDSSSVGESDSDSVRESSDSDEGTSPPAPAPPIIKAEPKSETCETCGNTMCGYIYIMSDNRPGERSGSQRFKIGYSFRPTFRFRTARTSNPELVLLHTFHVSNEPDRRNLQQIESACHTALADHLLAYQNVNEWFEFDSFKVARRRTKKALRGLDLSVEPLCSADVNIDGVEDDE
jgi:hypothetical protein